MAQNDRFWPLSTLAGALIRLERRASLSVSLTVIPPLFLLFLLRHPGLDGQPVVYGPLYGSFSILRSLYQEHNRLLYVELSCQEDDMCQIVFLRAVL